MKSILKRIYWKLPISQKWKEKIGRKRYEIIIRKEEKYEKAGKLNLIRDREQLYKYTQYVLKQYNSRSSQYVPYLHHDIGEKKVHLAAYYLTQFHPNPQNDEWWGKGITEWNNVNQAIPQFIGHYQPRKPGELGYYDLRLKDVMVRQIELAHNYGIDIFCFYYYWFDGKRLLEQPLNMFLKNLDLNIKFCYCWANENWTKRFSGTDEGVLMKISPTEENYMKFIYSILDDFMDERYYRINNKPVILIYRPSLIPNPKKVLKCWRKLVMEKYKFDIYIIAVQERDVSYNWACEGFDAETEFQPKQIEHLCKEITEEEHPIRKDFSGHIYDYEDLVKNKIYEIETNQKKKVYSAVMPMWDNTARRNFRGLIFHNASPELYKQWLNNVIKNTLERKDVDDKLVFINAWNEWGEGAYLEPDQYWGYAYLEATYEASRII